MPKFSTHVALMDPEYRPASFGPGDEVPEWAIDQVGDHVLEPEERKATDESESDSDSEEQEQGSDSDPEDDGDTDGEDPTPPAADDQPDFTSPAPARRGRTKK